MSPYNFQMIKSGFLVWLYIRLELVFPLNITQASTTTICIYNCQLIFGLLTPEHYCVSYGLQMSLQPF